MFQWFIRFPEFTEFIEFLIHLGKTPLVFYDVCGFPKLSEMLFKIGNFASKISRIPVYRLQVYPEKDTLPKTTLSSSTFSPRKF